jgi:hypothetical protein
MVLVSKRWILDNVQTFPATVENLTLKILRISRNLTKVLKQIRNIEKIIIEKGKEGKYSISLFLAGLDGLKYFLSLNIPGK